MDDIFKSKEDIQREEKINHLFKPDANFIGNLKEKESMVIPESERIIVEEPKKRNWKILANVLMMLFFLGLAAMGGYFWWQYKKVSQNSKAVSIAPSSDEVEMLAAKIKVFMELPQEKPILGTFANQEKLTDQSLFSNSQEGDKVLIYIQSQKAILYRPSSNQVIESIFLLPGRAADNKAETGETSVGVDGNTKKIETKIKVDVLNGTEIKGLAKETADKLSEIENVELAKVSNAQKSTYTKILVVDLSGKNEIAAKIIAEKVGGEIGSLPEGENKGTADILVITVRQ